MNCVIIAWYSVLSRFDWTNIISNSIDLIIYKRVVYNIN